MRDGTFRNVAAEVGLAVEGPLRVAAAGDVNKDGYVDFFFARAGGAGTLALSDGRGRFAVSAADESTANAQGAQFVDYDNDGLLDLVALTPGGLRVVRNLGTRWMDVTGSAVPGSVSVSGAGGSSLAAGDIDGDGDDDLVVGGTSSPHPSERRRKPSPFGPRPSHRARQQPQRARSED